MTRIIASLLLFVFALCIGYSAHSQLNPEQEFLRRNCYQLNEPHKQIERCLAILNEVKPISHSAIYMYISMAYFSLHDLDNAIAYQAKAAKNYGANPLDYNKLSSDDKRSMMKAWQAAYSYHFEKLGNLESLKSLQLYVDLGDTERAIGFSQAAWTSFTTAIHIDPLNHSAYASRADVNARLCRSDEASSDRRSAIEIAARAGDMKAVEKYNSINPDPTDCSRKP